MKFIFTIVICFFINTYYSQFQLDTAKLALFGSNSISANQIRQADSLLLSAVNYYNSKTTRDDYYCISLNDAQYADYLQLKRKERIVNNHTTRNGKIKHSALFHYTKPERKKIIEIIHQKDSLIVKLDSLREIGKPSENDSIISCWGNIGQIELQNYYRQYKYYIDEKGNFNINVLCFCLEYTHLLNEMSKGKTPIWRQMPLKMRNGGSCVFSIQLDLKTNKAKRMCVNGI